MKNNLNDLNNYLFETLERLNDDEELKEEGALEKEISRAKAITNVSSAIVQNAKVALEATKFAQEYGIKNPSDLLKLKSDEQ